MNKYLVCIIIFTISFQYGIAQDLTSYCDQSYQVGKVKCINNYPSVVEIQFEYLQNCLSPETGTITPSKDYLIELTDFSMNTLLPMLTTAFANGYDIAFQSVYCDEYYDLITQIVLDDAL